MGIFTPNKKFNLDFIKKLLSQTYSTFIAADLSSGVCITNGIPNSEEIRQLEKGEPYSYICIDDERSD